MPEEKTLTHEQVAAWLTVEMVREIAMEAVKAQIKNASEMSPEKAGQAATETFFAAALRARQLSQQHAYQ